MSPCRTESAKVQYLGRAPDVFSTARQEMKSKTHQMFRGVTLAFWDKDKKGGKVTRKGARFLMEKRTNRMDRGREWPRWRSEGTQKRLGEETDDEEGTADDMQISAAATNHCHKYWSKWSLWLTNKNKKTAKEEPIDEVVIKKANGIYYSQAGNFRYLQCRFMFTTGPFYGGAGTPAALPYRNKLGDRHRTMAQRQEEGARGRVTAEGRGGHIKLFTCGLEKRAVGAEGKRRRRRNGIRHEERSSRADWSGRQQKQEKKSKKPNDVLFESLQGGGGKGTNKTNKKLIDDPFGSSSESKHNLMVTHFCSIGNADKLWRKIARI